MIGVHYNRIKRWETSGRIAFVSVNPGRPGREAVRIPVAEVVRLLTERRSEKPRERTPPRDPVVKENEALRTENNELRATLRDLSGRSRGAMKARVKQLDVTQVSCSTPLDLYDTSSLGGSGLSIYARGLWINLSTFGFDNRTTSYQVGACAIDLSSGPNGGGNRYPRCLYAGCTENLMLSGWNNTLSSAYLH